MLPESAYSLSYCLCLCLCPSHARLAHCLLLSLSCARHTFSTKHPKIIQKEKNKIAGRRPFCFFFRQFHFAIVLLVLVLLLLLLSSLTCCLLSLAPSLWRPHRQLASPLLAQHTPNTSNSTSHRCFLCRRSLNRANLSVSILLLFFFLTRSICAHFCKICTICKSRRFAPYTFFLLFYNDCFCLCGFNCWFLRIWNILQKLISWILGIGKICWNKYNSYNFLQ